WTSAPPLLISGGARRLGSAYAPVARRLSYVIVSEGFAHVLIAATLGTLSKHGDAARANPACRNLRGAERGFTAHGALPLLVSDRGNQESVVYLLAFAQTALFSFVFG